MKDRCTMKWAHGDFCVTQTAKAVAHRSLLLLTLTRRSKHTCSCPPASLLFVWWAGLNNLENFCRLDSAWEIILFGGNVNTLKSTKVSMTGEVFLEVGPEGTLSRCHARRYPHLVPHTVQP